MYAISRSAVTLLGCSAKDFLKPALELLVSRKRDWSFPEVGFIDNPSKMIRITPDLLGDDELSMITEFSDHTGDEPFEAFHLPLLKRWKSPV